MSKPTKHSYLPYTDEHTKSFQTLLDTLKDISIVDVAKKLNIPIDKFSKQGGNLTGACPTGHPSVSGKSFHITPHLNLYHCWHCGIGGDNISLVEDVLKVSFIDALEWLINSFNIKVDLSTLAIKKRTPEELAEDLKRRTKTLLYEELISWGKGLLYDHQTTDKDAIIAREYLTKHRKYDEGILKTTEFFYIPSTKQAKDHLFKKFPEYKEDILKLNVAGGGYLDNMKVNIPYRDVHGNISGLIKRHHTTAGMTVTNSDGSTRLARWDSTPGVKKEDMFGLYGLKRMNKAATEAVIVEGYPDSMYMQALGLPVLSLGSGLPTESQLDSLLKLKQLQSVTLCLDNDNAGIKNTNIVLIKLSKRSNLVIQVLPHEELEPFKDIDEYLRKNGDIETEKLLDTKSILGVFWFINRLKKMKHGRLHPGSLNEIYNLIASSPISVQGLVISKSKEYLGMAISALKPILKEKELQRWNSLYNLDSSANPINSWAKVPFTCEEGYGIYDRTKASPAPEQMTTDEIKDLTSFRKVFISSKGRNHVEDLVRGFISLPPVLPELNLTYDPQNFYDIDPKRRLINQFIPTKWMFYDKTDEIISPVTEFPTIYGFIDHLLGSDEKVDADFIINWLATIFNERKKIRTSLLIVGSQGSGKNVFVDFILKYLFGFPNISVVGDAQLNSQYNDYLDGKLFVVFNELSSLKESQRSVQTFLKGLITDNTYKENVKYMRLQEKIAWFNFIFISNFLSPVAIDINDRRFIAVKTPSVKLEQSSFFKANGWSSKDFEKFRANVEKEFPRFVQYLKNYNYDEDRANTAIMNKTKLNMIEDNNTIFVQFAEMIKTRDVDELNFLQQDGLKNTEQNPYPWEEEHLKLGLIEVNQALNIINQMANFKQPIVQHTLKNKLYEQGIDKKRLRVPCSWKPNVERSHFYVLPTSDYYNKTAMQRFNTTKQENKKDETTET